jgi:two-component system, NarL family, invasion response regulator UvrY
MLRIALCDDHPIFRQGLTTILHPQSDIRVELETASGAELLQKSADKHLDVIVLDISLPDMNGLDVIKALRAAGIAAGVLVLSMHPEEQYARRMLKAGASGYLQKDSPPEEFIAAIRKIAKGGRYVTAHLAERLAQDLDGRADKPAHELLSDREYQVLCLLASGKGVKEIAQELRLSAPTVSTYRARVFEKLGISSTAELVRYAIAHGLTPA